MEVSAPEKLLVRLALQTRRPMPRRPTLPGAGQFNGCSRHALDRPANRRGYKNIKPDHIDQVAQSRFYGDYNMTTNMISVRREAVDWLKKHYPALCEKSGLCERVAGRVYTRTTLSAALPPQTNTITHRTLQTRHIYLSGPMTGIPEYNYQAFHAEAARLRGLGYTVVNPAEIDKGNSASWQNCLRTDLRALLGCDAITLLPGWQTSQGAHLELHVAHRVGIEILDTADIHASTNFPLPEIDVRGI